MMQLVTACRDMSRGFTRNGETNLINLSRKSPVDLSGARESAPNDVRFDILKINLKPTFLLKSYVQVAESQL